MRNLIKGELFKLIKSKGIKLTIILALISSAIFCCYYLISIQKNPQSFNNISGISILYLLLSGVAYENFITSIVAAIFVCRDFEKQTINMTFTYEYSRTKILLSKFLVYLICSVTITYIFIFSSTVVFSMLYGFEKNLTIYSILIILKSIVVNILGIIAISSITFLISVLTRSSIFTIVSPIFIFFIYMVVSNFHNPMIANLLPFDLVINALTNDVKFIDIFKLLISCFLTTIFSLYIGNSYLKRMEFK